MRRDTSLLKLWNTVGGEVIFFFLITRTFRDNFKFRKFRKALFCGTMSFLCKFLTPRHLFSRCYRADQRFQTPARKEKTNSVSYRIFVHFISESKLSNEEQTDADSDESSDDSNTCDCLEKHIHEFFHELRNFDMTSWDIDSVYKLVSNLAELTIKEFDEYNIALSLILGETIRHWHPEASDTAELFLRISEKDDADLCSLILTLCNAPVRVKFLESHVACILTAAQRKFTKDWTSEAIGKLLQSVEDNGFNIDATEVFHRMGKELGDAETLGRLVRDYLVATGDKDSFNCRCKTVECECPVAVDEGIAFIVFAGLERKMNWDEESKLKFFRSATDTLWTPEVLSELGKLVKHNHVFDLICVCGAMLLVQKSTHAACFSQSEQTCSLFNQSGAKP